MAQVKNPVTGQVFTSSGNLSDYTDRGWSVVSPSTPSSGNYLTNPNTGSAPANTSTSANPSTWSINPVNQGVANPSNLNNNNIGLQYKPYVPTVLPQPATTSDSRMDANQYRVDATMNKQNSPAGKLLTPTEFRQLAQGKTNEQVESMVRRGATGNIYMGSLQTEKNALPDYSAQFGMPKTTQQWNQFHDYAYGGVLPKTNMPTGAKGDGGPSDIPPAPEIAEETTNTISELKFMEKLMADIQSINTLIADERAAYDNSVVDLGHELGTTMPLIQGEQAYQEAKKNVALQRLVDLKSNVIEGGKLQMQVYEYTRQLRQDQQDAMASVMDIYLKNGIALPDSMAEKYANLTGVDARALKDGFAVAAKNFLQQQTLDNQLKQAQIKSAGSADTPSSYDEWRLAGGLGGTGLTYGEFLAKDVKPSTVDERKVFGYAERLSQSHEIINELEGVGQSLWGVVTGSDSYPNIFKSADRQKFEQAKRNFVNASLRRESGAVISEQEFENANLQYFPQPGDSDEVIVQKRNNRIQQMENLYNEAGSANTNTNTATDGWF